MHSGRRIPLTISGARLTRFFLRFLVFLGMMLFISIVFGVNGSINLYAIIVTLLLCGAIAICCCVTHYSRADLREKQIAYEIIESFPDASSEELYALYSEQRRRELRLEALFYVFLAVCAFIWAVLLKLIGADHIAVLISVLCAAPTMLIIAAVLFTTSFFYQNQSKIDSIGEYLSNPELVKAMCERKNRPDKRKTDRIIAVIETDCEPTLEEACSTVKKEASSRRIPWSLHLGTAFFFGLPCLMFFLSLPSLFNDRSFSWFTLGTGSLTFLGGILMAAAYKRARRKFVTMRIIRKANKADKNGSLNKDRVLSIIIKPDMENYNAPCLTEICFERSGLFCWWESDIKNTKRLPRAEGCDAFLLKSDDSFLMTYLLLDNKRQ